MRENVVYLDNAATTRQKPHAVYEATSSYMRDVCASPGRSSHRLAVEAGRIIFQARERLSKLFNASDSSRIALRDTLCGEPAEHTAEVDYVGRGRCG